MEKATYSVDVFCNNCDKTGVAKIPKGQLVPVLMECPHCGCMVAKKRGKASIQETDGLWPCIQPRTLSTLVVESQDELPQIPMNKPCELPRHVPIYMNNGGHEVPYTEKDVIPAERPVIGLEPTSQMGLNW